jgi:hypothetical protein
MRRNGFCLTAILATVGAIGPARAQENAMSASQWMRVETTAPEGGGPPARKHHSAVYDPVGHRMLIFGGRSSQGVLGDTWSLDLATRRWTRIEGAAKPSNRFGATAVYDAPRRRMVLFSGETAQFRFLNDVWALDLEQDRWSELTPMTTADGAPARAPNIRYGGASIYDERRERLVTFAGFTDSGRFNDTWSFDLKMNQWIDVSPAGPRPLKRCLLAAAYDVLGDRMIIHGGQSTGHLEDTWAFDLAQNTWVEIKNSAIPPGRFRSALVYHPEKRRAVMFGGQNNNLGYLDDTWVLALDGDRWEPLSPAGDTRPAARSGHTAVYDPMQRRMLIFGGQGDDEHNDVWALTNLAPAP